MGPSLPRRLFDFYCVERTTVICQVTDNIQVARSYPSPSITLLGHGLLTSFWFIAVVAYGCFVSYQWFNTPDTITTTQLPASSFSVPTISITAYCTNPPYCGVITISANYTGVPGCSAIPTKVVTTDANPAAPLTAVVPLCFTGQRVYTTNTRGPLAVPGVIVDFSAVNPGMDNTVVPNVVNPALKALGVAVIQMQDSGSSTAPVSRTVSLDSWQVRSLTMTRRVTTVYGTQTSSVGVPLAVQYEGRRPNWRATLLVSHAAYVYSSSTQQTNSLSTVVGVMSLITSWSGMIFFIGNFMGHFVTPLVVRFFSVPPPDEVAPAAATKTATAMKDLDTEMDGAATTQEPLLGFETRTKATTDDL